MSDTFRTSISRGAAASLKTFCGCAYLNSSRDDSTADTQSSTYSMIHPETAALRLLYLSSTGAKKTNGERPATPGNADKKSKSAQNTFIRGRTPFLYCTKLKVCRTLSYTIQQSFSTILSFSYVL